MLFYKLAYSPCIVILGKIKVLLRGEKLTRMRLYVLPSYKADHRVDSRLRMGSWRFAIYESNLILSSLDLD